LQLSRNVLGATFFRLVYLLLRLHLTTSSLMDGWREGGKETSIDEDI
jgi:hypothetical protein